MDKSLNILLFIFAFYLSSCTKPTELHQSINLNSGWEFKTSEQNQFHKATVPGSIHTDLFENNLIKDPDVGTNEDSLAWIDMVDWIYQKEFSKSKNLKPDDQLEIVFKGLDTYAKVYLNDSLIITANNMFLPWKAKLDQAKLKDKNVLKVKFEPSLKHEQKKYNYLEYELPGGSRIFTRKAAYQYGWDWAPKYIGCGIWQDVELHIWNTSKIQNLNYSIEKLDSNVAIVKLQASIESQENFNGKIKFISVNKDLKYEFDNIDIKKGIHTYDFEVAIRNPKLWWTHNLGEAFLYQFNFSLENKNKIYDSKKIDIGLRTIKLIQEPDQYGESFYFKLNGIPVFMKGANYVPQSSFPGSVSEVQYKNIITQVKASNMNMLRIWGGGIYEKEIFYELCDEAGILIWQDFMFANAMYPDDSSLLRNIKNEAKFQVGRLGKHPCIAIWCGNNEIDEAWHNWGWSSSYSKSDSSEIWNNYLTIFHKILPEIVDSLSPSVPYTSSSPLFGRGNPRSSFEGDNHYWYVWHDAYDFDWYNTITGRFMSEFGFQSFPEIETIELFDTSKTKRTDSDIMLAHQKHWRGNYLINLYMKDYYKVPTKFEDFIYVSQLLQADGIRTGILAQRRAKPFCMGSLYWQLNDCWPSISWSSIDYSGQWKALQYFAQEDFKNIILDPYLTKDSLKIFIVSDTLKDITLIMKADLMDFEGNIKTQKEININAKKNSSNLFYKESISNVLKDNKPNNHLLFLELLQEDKPLDTRIVYFTKPKNLKLAKSNILKNIETNEEGYEISLTSNTLVKNLYIHIPKSGQLSCNYFDLIPNHEKKVYFKTNEKIDNLSDIIKIKSLNQIHYEVTNPTK